MRIERILKVRLFNIVNLRKGKGRQKGGEEGNNPRESKAADGRGNDGSVKGPGARGVLHSHPYQDQES